MKLLQSSLILVFITLSQNLSAQWTNPDLGLTGKAIQCFVNMDTVILAGTDGGLVRSTNNGATWANFGGIMGGKNIHDLFSLTSYPFNVLSGTINYGAGGVFQSTNYGESWTGFPTDPVQPPTLAHVNSILKKETSSEFWVGTDLGVYLLPQFYPLSSWIPYSTGLASGEYTKVRAMLYANGEIFAGTDNGVYILNGSTWVQKNSGLTNTNITALKSVDGYLIAGTSQGSVGGIYISSDTAKTWTLSNSDAWITSILTIGSNIFVGSYGNGVWLSTNYGTTWNQVNSGLGSGAYNVLSLGANTQFLFAGTVSSSIWCRPLSQMITVITAVHETDFQPKTFSLEQNYPNPFNPSTTIAFGIPARSQVTLKIYDLLGKEVATLVNNEIVAEGSYTKQWNAQNFPSGVYFYRLQAGSFTQTKRLVLLK
jgi:ligand-binding sensor domain-containing protein